MTTFIALYRGESVATARLIAVNSERAIVSKFMRELARDDNEHTPREEHTPFTIIRGDAE